jgi:hypothetical protein
MTIHRNRMDDVRVVSRMGMRKCGVGNGRTRSLRLNLPTVVEDRYCKLSGQLELLMTGRKGVERHVSRRVE